MKQHSAPQTTGARTILGALLLSLSLQIAVQGQSGSETLSFFGNLGQGNASVNGLQVLKNNSCAPTAVANGLTYLENYFQSVSRPDPFTTSPNTYTQLNNLQTAMGTGNGGTPLNTLWSGLQTYLSAGGANPAPTLTLAGQQDLATVTGLNWGSQAGATNVIPTASFLANNLNANNAVMLSIEWGSFTGNTWTPVGGGHEITLQQIDIGGGTIGFIDPWGPGVGNNAGATSASVSGSVTTVAGYLYITYPITIAGGADPADQTGTDQTTFIGANNGETARVVADTVVTPEPTCVALTLVGALGLLMMRRR
jgi:hypothetical protein